MLRVLLTLLVLGLTHEGLRFILFLVNQPNDAAVITGAILLPLTVGSAFVLVVRIWRKREKSNR